MIRITINGKKKYKGIYSWNDLTLAKFCDLAAIPMPEGYEAYILADGKYTIENIQEYIDAVAEITEKQLNEDFPIYYRRVIEVLTNIPYKEIALMSTQQVNDLYEIYFKPFVASLLYHSPVIHFMGQIKAYEPEKIKSFRLGFNRFYLPETVNIMGQDVPLAKEPIITYTEASDIFRGMKISRDDVKNLALFMSIYCRKKGEEYDERKALERQELMMKARMNVVWSVFFYTVRRLPDFTASFQLFGNLPKHLEEVVHQARAFKSSAVTA